VSEYRELTDSQLQHLIAERLGYANLHLAHYFTDDTEVGYYEEERLRGDFNGHTEVLVPEWPTDADAALRLLESITEIYDREAFAITPRLDGKKWLWRAFFGSLWGDFDERNIEHLTEAETPARAICEAWLDFQDTKAQNQ
jgi:hypothetical protein